MIIDLGGGPDYLIWSTKKKAWWAPLQKKGFTTDIDRAGRYLMDEAISKTRSLDGKLLDIPIQEDVARMIWLK